MSDVVAPAVAAADAAPAVDAPAVDAPAVDAPTVDAPTAAPAPTTPDLKFVSSDNEEFLIPANVIKMSVTVKNLLNDLGLENQEKTNEDPIPLQNVDAKTLKKVLAWCRHHLENPIQVPAEGEADKKELSPYAVEFFNCSQTEIFEVILAANYLDIQCLLSAGCKTIANMMKGKTAEQLRAQFGIINDFTPEEEEEIRKENAWCED